MNDAAAERPVLFALHALGMDRGAWAACAAELSDIVEVVALDLPGFGGNRAAGFTCREMADGVAARIAARGGGPWMIAGHSMGGRIAMIVAAMAEAGAPGLAGLSHVVLAASSTPGPEPIDAAARARMLSWVAGGDALTDAQARRFVADNTVAGLTGQAEEIALSALGQADPVAWRHWLDRGSREDWSDVVGRLYTPALILAGAGDGPLGEAVQRAVNAPAFHDATVAVIGGAAHLVPLERPGALAREIREFVTVSRPVAGLSAGFVRLLHSDRVSARTRAAMIARNAACAVPGGWGDHMPGLRAVAESVLPGHAARVPDLAARVARGATGGGDGWRFADLPGDAEALATGLRALDGIAAGGGGFAALDGTAQEALLRDVAAGGVAAGGWTGGQMARWFEDLRAMLVRAYVAHPAVLDGMGFDGFANGGDGPRQQGYVLTDADRMEAWQGGETGR